MGTKIEYQTWSGGSGYGDPKYLLGYCKESPQEVLEQILLTHDVYHYKELYRPIDWDYPNNVEGLIINEFSRNDLEVTGDFKDLDLHRAETKHNRTKQTILDSFELCKKWHHYSREDLNKKYSVLFKEVENIINKLQ